MVRRIIWTRKAIEERKEILNYWNKRNQSKFYSKKLNNLFLEKIGRIAFYPLTGRITDQENIRVTIVKEYLIFYEIEDTQIIILTIWDGRRNPEDLKMI